LGIRLERRLTWKAHIKDMENKAMQRCITLSRTLNRKIKTHLYKSWIRPIPLHGAIAWDSAAKSTMKKLQVIENKILWSIYNWNRYTSSTSMHIALDVRSLNDEIKRASAKLYQRPRQHDIHIHETEADLTLSDHTCGQRTSDALVSQ
jgi:hypothetical protein